DFAAVSDATATPPFLVAFFVVAFFVADLVAVFFFAAIAVGPRSGVDVGTRPHGAGYTAKLLSEIYHAREDGDGGDPAVFARFSGVPRPTRRRKLNLIELATP